MRTLTALTTMIVAFTFAGCSELSNREDFASQLKNKTEQEVRKYTGEPAQVDNERSGRTSWIYKSRTFDIATRKTDAKTIVIFAPADDGKLHVTEVVFE